jgi:hypothetical protein
MWMRKRPRSRSRWSDEPVARSWGAPPPRGPAGGGGARRLAAPAVRPADIRGAWEPGGLRQHPRRDDILTATRRHDDGWQEEDADLHIGRDGHPLDFVAVPPAVKQRIWRRATGRLAEISPYVAALVAEHALTIHAPLRADPAWRAFFERMEAIRDAALTRSQRDLPALGEDYPFIRTGALALNCCLNWMTQPSVSCTG